MPLILVAPHTQEDLIRPLEWIVCLSRFLSMDANIQQWKKRETKENRTKNQRAKSRIRWSIQPLKVPRLRMSPSCPALPWPWGSDGSISRGLCVRRRAAVSLSAEGQCSRKTWSLVLLYYVLCLFLRPPWRGLWSPLPRWTPLCLVPRLGCAKSFLHSSSALLPPGLLLWSLGDEVWHVHPDSVFARVSAFGLFHMTGFKL